MCNAKGTLQHTYTHKKIRLIMHYEKLSDLRIVGEDYKVITYPVTDRNDTLIQVNILSSPLIVLKSTLVKTIFIQLQIKISLIYLRLRCLINNSHEIKIQSIINSIKIHRGIQVSINVISLFQSYIQFLDSLESCLLNFHKL